jgi:hypothetical protein
MKRKMERSSGITPLDLRGTSPVQGSVNNPAAPAEGTGRQPYQPPVFETYEIELENGIMADSGVITGRNAGQFTIDDYTAGTDQIVGDIELL